MLRRLADWYRGTPVVQDRWSDSDPAIVGVTYRRRWTAEAMRALVGFWMRHWRWIIGTAIAVASPLAAGAK